MNLYINVEADSKLFNLKLGVRTPQSIYTFNLTIEKDANYMKIFKNLYIFIINQ